MQSSRLLEILFLLLEKRKLTATELAEQFEVSVRTIYRDIDSLSAAGIPVFTTTGRNGGVALLEGYTLDRSLLSSDEQDDILVALQALSATHTIDTVNILRKMAVLFKKPEINWLEVDFARWGNPGQDERSRFNLLKEAVMTRQCVSFDYINTKGERNVRRVEPHKLLFKDKAWYLCGFCLNKSDLRLFRISRMENEALLSDGFDRKVDVDVFLSNAIQSYGPLVHLELTVLPSAAHRLYDIFSKAAISSLKDGNYQVRENIPEDDWLYSFLLSLGTDIVELHPILVRKKLLLKHEESITKLKESDGYDD